jgi:hypothetical protein
MPARKDGMAKRKATREKLKPIDFNWVFRTTTKGFGKRLAQAIKDAGYTVEQFAEITGASVEWVQFHIRQETQAANDELGFTFAVLLNVPYDWLRFGDKQMAKAMKHCDRLKRRRATKQARAKSHAA